MHANKINITIKLLRKPFILKNNINRCLFNIIHNYTTTIDAIDVFTNDWSKSQIANPQKHRMNYFFGGNDNKLSYFSKTDSNKISEHAEMNKEELESYILDLMSKNKDKQIIDILKTCYDHHKFLSENTLNMLYQNYSKAGKPDIIVVLQNYCSTVDNTNYMRNGEFLHHLAKAHCFKGNSEKGLTTLLSCYEKYAHLRSCYRITFRELIQDTVTNRSEAALVIFRKYVLIFSNKWHDNYPLVCFWHLCWSSSWFSDQTLADELLETSSKLQEIVKDKATIFCINILRDYNDDAVMRLLQVLLKYKMMSEYTKVLQVLFNYKLRNRDIRGCMEISRNCETLGVTLPADQQGRYLKMLIKNDVVGRKYATTKPALKNFKLKF